MIKYILNKNHGAHCDGDLAEAIGSLLQANSSYNKFMTFKDYTHIFESTVTKSSSVPVGHPLVKLNLEDKKFLVNSNLVINNRKISSIKNNLLNRVPSGLLFAVKARDVLEIKIRTQKHKILITVKESELVHLRQLITDCLLESWESAVNETFSKLKLRLSSKSVSTAKGYSVYMECQVCQFLINRSVVISSKSVKRHFRKVHTAFDFEKGMEHITQFFRIHEMSYNLG